MGQKILYVLYEGNLKFHKNLGVLIEAFCLIKDRFPDIGLVLAGVEPDRAFKQAAAESFVFPSLYEGFGSPPLEAMARKKAVISSVGGSLREILGDNALFFSPILRRIWLKRSVFSSKTKEERAIMKQRVSPTARSSVLGKR